MLSAHGGLPRSKQRYTSLITFISPSVFSFWLFLPAAWPVSTIFPFQVCHAGKKKRKEPYWGGGCSHFYENWSFFIQKLHNPILPTAFCYEKMALQRHSCFKISQERTFICYYFTKARLKVMKESNKRKENHKQDWNVSLCLYKLTTTKCHLSSFMKYCIVLLFCRTYKVHFSCNWISLLLFYLINILLLQISLQT